MEKTKQTADSAASHGQLEQVKAFLGDKGAVRQMMGSLEAQKLLNQLQKTDRGQLQSAAQAALQGDASALGTILQRLSQDPEAAKAMQTLDQKLNP